MKNKTKHKPLSYKDIEEIVEYLVKVKSRDYTFDCYEIDDIGQEIRLICFKALNHFDFGKVNQDKLVNYFGTCVDNRLKNLRRDKYIRYQSPCNSDCKMLHGDDPENELSKICKKWLRHQEGIAQKKIIKNPISIDAVGDIKDNKFEKLIEAEDIKKFLIDNIEDNLRPSLLKILMGYKTKVPIKKRREIQISVKRILG